MNPLHKAIKENANAAAQSEDWVAVAAILNATDQPARITELRNSRWLMNELAEDLGNGTTEADVVLSTMQASTIPRVKEALKLMGSDGVDLSDPQSQAMLTVLASAGGWSSTITDKLHALSFDYTSKAQLAGHPGVTAATCQAVYEAETANEAGNVVFDLRRVLLCMNDGPVNDSFTLRVTPLAVVSGIEVSGTTTTIGGVASNFTGRELALYLAIHSLVDNYLGGN